MNTQGHDSTPEKRRRAVSSGISLTESDAALVKGMLLRGDRWSDIASCFGVNQARIADVSSGKTFADVPVAAEAELPPSGPYLPTVTARAARAEIALARAALDRAEQLISRHSI